MYAEFLERFGDQLVGDAVSAARAIVSLVLQFGLALIEVIEQRRLGMDLFVTVVIGTDAGFGRSLRLSFRIRSVDHNLVGHFRCLPADRREPVLDLNGDSRHHLFLQLSDRGHVAAYAAIKLDWHFAVQRQTHILHHLSVAQFDDQYFVYLGSRIF